jgi:hypothetical protein
LHWLARMEHKNFYCNIKNILNLGCELEPKLGWAETCSRDHVCFEAERRFLKLCKSAGCLRRSWQACAVQRHQSPCANALYADTRSMATSGKDTGMVGYNVQAVVEAQHHLIVAHEVTNIGNDRSQLSTMAKQAQEATGVRALTAIADRGNFKGEERFWRARRRA